MVRRDVHESVRVPGPGRADRTGHVHLDTNKTDDPRDWDLRPDVARALKVCKDRYCRRRKQATTSSRRTASPSARSTSRTSCERTSHGWV
jgi:hypothetical protein